MSNTSHGGHADDLSRLQALSAWTTDQYTIQQTDTPEALPDLPGEYVAVKALSGNSGPVEVRSAGASAGWPLAAGEETGLLPLDDAQLIEVYGSAGDGVAFFVIG